MTVAKPQSLPHWDMSVVYPGLDSPEFAAGFRDYVTAIDELQALFDTHAIGQQAEVTLDDTTVAAFDTILAQFNDVQERSQTLSGYIYSFVATDSRNEQAHSALSVLDQQEVRLTQLSTRLTAWIGSLDVEALIAQSGPAHDHAFMLRRAGQQAAHLMSPAEETIAAELQITGGSAWGRLYSTWTSQLQVPILIDGQEQRLPMSEVRNLAYDADRTVRRRAYEAELATWAAADVPIAAALNSIKGEMNTLSRRRHWGSPLDVALFNSNIDRPTLDAMMEAMRESFPDFRRYLKAKARALNIPSLAWYDLFAPLNTEERDWSYDEGAAFICRQFATFSPKLRDLAERAFRENWIDAEPRSGKGDGAFCFPLRHDESRILANFKPVFGQVSTLAHELGHAYHNLNLAGRTALQRITPMTFAETASIFCETLIRQAAFGQATAAEQLALLESSLQNACQIIVDISSRFLFEQQVFDTRQQHEVAVAELKEIMLDAQRQTYGDGLDANALHPYMWAAKPHYYGDSFYNFPYAFGLLFSLGLYARYQSEPADFTTRYDDLLSSTGLVEAGDLAARFGIDLRTPEFWRSSLDIIRADIVRFEKLTSTS